MKTGKCMFQRPESSFVAEIDDAVLTAVAEACERDRSGISSQTSLLQLGLDSLALTVVVAQLQVRYRFEAQPDELADLFGARAVADIAALVKRKLGLA